MRTVIRAVVINPHTKTITTETLMPGDTEDTSTYESIRHIVFAGQSFGYLEHMAVGQCHGIYFDEQGGFRDQAYFKLGPVYIPGIAVMLFDTWDGGIDDCLLLPEEIEPKVKWVEDNSEVPEPSCTFLAWDDAHQAYESETVVVLIGE